MAKQSRRQQKRTAGKPQTTRSLFNDNIRLTPKQEELNQIIKDNQIIICTGPAGTAKAQPLTSKILTPTGWITMADATPGTVILSSTGEHQTILSIHPQGKKQTYLITTNTGATTKCTADHLWFAKVGNGHLITTTEHLITLLNNGTPVEIPLTPYLDFEEHPFFSKMSARTLGALASTGSIQKKDILVDIDAPVWLLENIRDHSDRPFSSAHDANRFYGAASIQGIRTDMTRINYSQTERFEILQGAAEARGMSTFINQSINTFDPNFTCWLADIARSLGYLVTQQDTKITITQSTSRYQRITSISVDSIEECQCISISHSDNLYITDNLMVTHNTYVTTYTALELTDQRLYDKIILTKPAQESGEKLGFLPGDVDEKIAPYMESFVTTMEKLVGAVTTKAFVDKDIIEARPLAYMRGSTFDNSIMILDEAQNCDLRQLILFVTRMGETSKVIICGDVEQYDVPQSQSGLSTFFEMTKNIKGVATFEFKREDIVRSKILIDITDNYHKYKSNQQKKQ